MEFESLKKLKDGDINFIYSMTNEQKKKFINTIRSSNEKIDIINVCLMELVNTFPDFCFDIIYDMDEFLEINLNLINSGQIDNISIDKLVNLLYNTKYGSEFIINNIDYFLNKSDTYIKNICIYYLYKYNDNKQFVYKLSRYSDLHVRYLFMSNLIQYNSKLLNEIYDDITLYFSNNDELMNVDDICNIAISLLKEENYVLYNKVKEYIYKNYKYNNLAYLLNYTKDDIRYIDICNEELDSNIEVLFLSALKDKIIIYEKYWERISGIIIDDFESRVNLLRVDNKFKKNVYNTFKVELGPKLEEYIDKYMSLSTSRETGYVASGTTCEVYRIGDYVIKLLNTKWSYEDIICPDLFLVVKNYEQEYVRNKKNIIVGGIEVQKYLSRDAKGIPEKYFAVFERTLSQLGYKINDTLINGSCGDNTKLLDSYMDANTDNPELLPDWFKEYPLVLIDRDRVYPKEKKLVLQQIGKY